MKEVDFRPAASPDVQGQGYVEILRSGPERIIVRMAIRPLTRGIRPDHRSSHPLFGNALEFLDGRPNVLERDEPERNKPLGIIATVLHRPVIVRLKTGSPQLSIIETVQGHAHRGVDHLGLHTVEVLVLNPGGWIPDTGRSLIKPLLVVLGQLL